MNLKQLRKENIETLQTLNLTEEQLNKTGLHPEFGVVTLRQLLSTWTVHDLSHMNQITRVIAKQYKAETGPWVEYIPLLQK